MSYYFNKILKSTNFNNAIELTINELKKEGFGVLTKISIDETLKNKIDVDFKKYSILGACNPKFAYEALKREDKIGVFLPWNVIVEEHENGDIEVSVVDPIASMISVKNDTIGELALEIQTKLKRVINNLK